MYRGARQPDGRARHPVAPVQVLGADSPLKMRAAKEPFAGSSAEREKKQE